MDENYYAYIANTGRSLKVDDYRIVVYNSSIYFDEIGDQSLKLLDKNDKPVYDVVVVWHYLERIDETVVYIYSDDDKKLLEVVDSKFVGKVDFDMVELSSRLVLKIDGIFIIRD